MVAINYSHNVGQYMDCSLINDTIQVNIWIAIKLMTQCRSIMDCYKLMTQYKLLYGLLLNK